MGNPNHEDCQDNASYSRGVKLVRYSPQAPILSVSTEHDMKVLLCQRGPLMVALDATQLQFYSSGIIDSDEGCTVADRLNHAVVLVEYTTIGNHYFRLKNSWGESWGEDGFFRVTTGRECMGLGTVVDVCQPAPVADGEPITPPPPSTPNPTTSVSTTTPVITTTRSTTVSTTTPVSTTTRSTNVSTTTPVSTTTGSTSVSTTTIPVTTTTAISTTGPF